MKKTLYFVRHGQTNYNKQHIVQGSGVDSDLNESGLEQGMMFFEAYKDIPFEVVFTSALKRTQQTVGAFIKAGIPWEPYTEINEISWGIHEGKKGDLAMRQNYLALNAAWTSGQLDERIEEGESANELGERVGRFMEMLKTRPEKTILICTHGRTMCAVSCFLEHRPLEDMHLFKHHNTGLTQAVYDGQRFEVLLKDDTSHLQHKEI